MENIIKSGCEEALHRLLKSLKSFPKTSFSKTSFSKTSFSAKNKTTEIDETLDLISRLNDTKVRLEAMRNAFEFETDFCMIEAYIMEINGLEKQYSHLLRRIKEKRSGCNERTFLT